MNCSCQFGSRRRKEFERVCTTVVNAYVGPALDRYLGRLAERLAEAGYAGPVLIMQSHGGLATVADAVRLAAGGVLSGPAGGVAGARHASRILGHGNLIAFDMGGTSTDMSLVVDGEAAVSTDRRVAGHRVALHSLDIASIGAGGGSIAHVDTGGVLHVGPRQRRRGPGPRLLRTRWHRAGRHRRQPGARVPRSIAVPGRPAAARHGGRRRRGGRDRRAAGHRPHGGGRGHSPHRQYPHGGRDPAGLGPARRRPAPLRAAVLRRSGGCPRHRRRARARSVARGGAAARSGVLRVGHARERPALRSCPNPHRRRQRPRRRAPRCAVPRDGGRGARAARRRPRSKARSSAAGARTCATGSRSSRWRCRSTASTGPDPTPSRPLPMRSMPATRRCTRTRCVIRKRCSSTPASPSWAGCRRLRPNPRALRGRRGHPARYAGCISAAGASSRCTTSTR